MKKIIIIDYKLGNLFSVKQACNSIGLNTKISSIREDILNADGLILPGVGAFNEAMYNLGSMGIIDAIKQRVKVDKIPLFGICLGMQLLFSESEEFKSSLGLNLIQGSIKRIPKNYKGIKMTVPHIAWNIIHKENIDWKYSPFSNLSNQQYMYFIHSYYAKPNKDSYILSTTKYNDFTFCSAIIKNNIFATQFHPEKSGKKGLNIYKKWAISNNVI